MSGCTIVSITLPLQTFLEISLIFFLVCFIFFSLLLLRYFLTVLRIWFEIGGCWGCRGISFTLLLLRFFWDFWRFLFFENLFWMSGMHDCQYYSPTADIFGDFYDIIFSLFHFFDFFDCIFLLFWEFCLKMVDFGVQECQYYPPTTDILEISLRLVF